MENATREVLWNVSSPLNAIALYSLLGVTLLVTGAGILSRFELWASGKSEPDFKGRWFSRLWKVTLWALLQRGVVREKRGGVMHTLLYVGFMVLLLTTTVVFIHNDLGIKIYQGDFYLILTV